VLPDGYEINGDAFLAGAELGLAIGLMTLLLLLVIGTIRRLLDV
jgi:hypothetical protein